MWGVTLSSAQTKCYERNFIFKHICTHEGRRATYGVCKQVKNIEPYCVKTLLKDLPAHSRCRYILLIHAHWIFIITLRSAIRKCRYILYGHIYVIDKQHNWREHKIEHSNIQNIHCSRLINKTRIIFASDTFLYCLVSCAVMTARQMKVIKTFNNVRCAEKCLAYHAEQWRQSDSRHNWVEFHYEAVQPSLNHSEESELVDALPLTCNRVRHYVSWLRDPSSARTSYVVQYNTNGYVYSQPTKFVLCVIRWFIFQCVLTFLFRSFSSAIQHNIIIS